METTITINRIGRTATAELSEDILIDPDALQELVYGLIMEIDNQSQKKE